MTQRNISADKNQSKYGVFGKSRANKMATSNEPIQIIIKNKEIGKDMMANSRQKENITCLLTTVLIADKV